MTAITYDKPILSFYVITNISMSEELVLQYHNEIILTLGSQNLAVIHGVVRAVINFQGIFRGWKRIHQDNLEYVQFCRGCCRSRIYLNM
jgi:hypothetical protein